MANCKYKGCNRQDWRNEDCIFHSQISNKDIDLFWNGIYEMIKEKDYNFRGFYFIPEKGETRLILRTLFLKNM